MPALSSIEQYLRQAAAAEQTFETQLRQFSAAAADDSDVRQAFASHADETTLQRQRLLTRLSELSGAPLAGESDTPPAEAAGKGDSLLLSLAPHIAHLPSVPEENQLQNLLAAYTVEAGECAGYEYLAQLAASAGDLRTETLARELQAEEQAMAATLWHLLPTRTKIAFNMLTVSELDPAVETKLADDRIES